MGIISKIIYYPLFCISLILAAALVTSGWSGYLPVKIFPLLSLTEMAFPAILLTNAMALILWLLLRPRSSWPQIAALLLVIPPTLTYSPLNFKSREHKCGEDEIRLLSYNTFGFGLWKNGLGGPQEDNPVLQYILKSNADIICIQEANSAMTYRYLYGSRNVMTALPNTGKSDNGEMLILSRWPVIETREITFEDTRNKSLYCRILIGEDTMAVYSCHFQSFGLSQDDIDEYNHIITHPQNYEEYGNSKPVLKKLMAAGIKRADQVGIITDMISHETARYIILCGDFNDTPLSYSHRKIAGLLNDAYRESGFGPGISYNRNRLYFRIDHVFCNDAVTPLKCRVDRSIRTSDHYPVITHLKIQ